MDYKKSNIIWETTIPKHWMEIKGKYIFNYEKEIIGDRWINEQRISLTYEGVIPRDNEDSSGLNPESLATYQVVKQNDLLFKLIDLENEKTSRVGLSSYNGITSSAYIRVNVNNMYPKYYFYWYYSLWFRYIYNRLGNGVRSTLNPKDLLDILVPVPPKEEQIRISKTIEESTNKIDKLIKNQQQQIEKLKEYKQSLISEVVTKGLDPNVEFKDSGIEWIGKIPTQWSVYKIKSLFATIGSGTTPNSADEYLYKDEVNWIQSGDLGTKYLKTVSKKVSEDALNSISTLRIYKSPFVVIAMYGASIGSLSISKIDSCTNQACCVLAEPKNIINIEYVYYFIQSTKEALVLHGKGGTQPNISQDTIKRFFITLPPLSEQNMIVDYLKTKVNKVDALITVKHSKIDKLNNYKKSLIYEYVTGKKEVS